jgi:hypothetical protein
MSSLPFTPPPHDNRIKMVHSFEELVTTAFADGVNALCWQRTLVGDFGEVVAKLAVRDGITTLDEEQLEALAVSEAGRVAIEVLLEDLRLLKARDLEPSLDCIDGYLRDEEPGPVPTDVYSFHVDSATVEADTYLCTYHGLASEGLRNEDAVRRVDVPETRAELLKLFGGEEGEAFEEYLQENCYDLHYVPVSPDVRSYGFGVGNLWRIATLHPGCPVPPCIHRAPETGPGDAVRLLLIS